MPIAALAQQVSARARASQGRQRHRLALADSALCFQVCGRRQSPSSPPCPVGLRYFAVSPPAWRDSHLSGCWTVLAAYARGSSGTQDVDMARLPFLWVFPIPVGGPSRSDQRQVVRCGDWIDCPLCHFGDRSRHARRFDPSHIIHHAPLSVDRYALARLALRF